jgi:selenocysteine-specific translation elongation factor
MNLTCGVFGDPDLPGELGKKGTTSDLALYNRKSGDDIYAFVTPLTYPDKLASLMQAMAMSDCAILAIKELTPEIGETIVALDSFGISKGVLVLENLIPEQVAPVIKGTVVENYAVVPRSFADIIDALSGMEPERKEGPLKIPIDHFFDVKSVGTVVLGVVERGNIKPYDKPEIQPLGREVLVKSIQMQDENVKEAGAGARVGLSLKGVDVEDLYRGCVICEPESIQPRDAFEVDLAMNRFAMDSIKKGQRYHISVGMHYNIVTVEEAGEKGEAKKGEKARIRVKSEKPIVAEAGDRVVFAKVELKGLRILGSGIVAQGG